MAYQRKEVNRMSARNDHDSTDVSTATVETLHDNARKPDDYQHQQHDHNDFSFHNHAYPEGHLLAAKQYEYYYNKIASLPSRCKNARSKSFSRRGAMSTCSTSYESKLADLDSSNHVCEEVTFENQKANEKKVPLKSIDSSTSKSISHDELQIIQNQVDNDEATSSTGFKDDDGFPKNSEKHFPTLAINSYEDCSLQREEEQKQDDSNPDKQFKDDFKQKFMAKGKSKRRIIVPPPPPASTTNNGNEPYNAKANTNIPPRNEDRISEMRNQFRKQRPRAKTESDLVCNQQFKNDFKEQFIITGSRRKFSQSDSNFTNARLLRDWNPPEFISQMRQEFQNQQRQTANVKRLVGRRGAISY